jgi:hypothetical protein
MIRRGVSNETTSAKQKHAVLLVIPDAARTSEVEQLLLGEGVAVVRTRVISKRLWEALLRIGTIVLIQGLAPEAAHQVAEELPVEVLDSYSRTPEEFVQQLREKSILPPQKASQQ